MPYQVFVLHSPYPDRTFRGIEKCAGAYVAGTETVGVFQLREDAEKALENLGDDGNYFQIVEAVLILPAVRAGLDSADFNKIVTEFKL